MKRFFYDHLKNILYLFFIIENILKKVEWLYSEFSLETVYEYSLGINAWDQIFLLFLPKWWNMKHGFILLMFHGIKNVLKCSVVKTLA